MAIVGRNPDSSWVYMSSDDNKTGWVSADLLTIEGNVERVSIRTASDVSSLAPAAKIQPTATHKPFIFSTSPPTLTNPDISNLAGTYLATNSIPTLSTLLCSEATNGDFVSCKIPVAYCEFRSDIDGNPTFCNDRPYPNQNFALVVFGKDWSNYDGLCIIVSGKVYLYRGVRQIEATSRSQISYCE